MDAFTKLKTEKVRKLVKIEKNILKTKACDSFPSASMERAPQNYKKKCINSKRPKIELDGFTKSGPNLYLGVVPQLYCFFASFLSYLVILFSLLSTYSCPF